MGNKFHPVSRSVHACWYRATGFTMLDPFGVVGSCRWDPENSGAVFLSKPTHSTNISLNPKKERIAMGKYLWKIPCCSLPHWCTMKKKPSMRSPCWIRSHPKHLACSYVAARFPPGARRSPPRSPSWNANGNPRSKCRFAWKNTSKWLMFHCHISLPEGRYPARPIVVTFHVSLLSIKKNFMLQIP